MPRRWRGTGLALIVSVLGLGGCAGDDISEEAYAERVNLVCRSIESELNQLARASPESAGETAELIDDVIGKSRAAVTRLKAIERPDGAGREAADRFVTTLERELEQQAIPALEDLRTAVKGQDREAAADAAARLERLERSESDRRARAVGADACAA
jgi:hypothetical protein